MQHAYKTHATSMHHGAQGRRHGPYPRHPKPSFSGSKRRTTTTIDNYQPTAHQGHWQTKPNGGDANRSTQTGFGVVERVEGGGELSCAGSAPDPRILLRAATQTKLNVNSRMGSRGPGTNEGDFLLRPHLAEIHPGRSRGRVCELLAGYKCNRRASRTGGLRDLRITRTDTAGNGSTDSRALPDQQQCPLEGRPPPYLTLP